MEQSCKIVEEKRQIIKQLINTEVEESGCIVVVEDNQIEITA